MDDLLSILPVLPQRQDSISEQLSDLKRVASRLGMYDAADAMTQLFESNKINDVKYGCHCDLEEDQEPDGCFIDEGKPHNCIYAKMAERKERCSYWRIIRRN